MGQKRKLLIAGGGHSDIPLINAARKLGFYVVTSGNRENDLGHRYADEVRLADFSDAEAMLSLAKDLEIQAVCSSCNDFSALSSAYVAEELGLPGHDPLQVARIIHHKDKYRRLAQKLGIPSPQAQGCQDLESVRKAICRIGFPLIIKPVDLTGGKGIARVTELEKALDAARFAFSISKAKRIVVEEFIVGSRHGFSAILRDERVVFHFTDDEHYHLSPYLVSAASAPASCTERTVSRLVEYSEKIAGELHLVDGVFHIQFIQPEVGDPVIIEICRRAPGDLYVELVRHATGAPYSDWILRASSGMDLSDVCPIPVRFPVTRHCLMANTQGMFRKFDFDPIIRASIIDEMIWAKEGDDVKDALTHKFGIVFVRHESLDKLRKEALRLQELLSVDMHA